jgi:hypothetical protein
VIAMLMERDNQDELTFEQGAVLARTTIDGLRSLWRRAELPTYRYGSRTLYIRRADLIALLQRRSIH